MSERKIRVLLHWGGDIVHDAGYVRYSVSPIVSQLFPVSLAYERLQRVFRSKMGIRDPEDVVVISGRYPSCITSTGHVVFSLMSISNNESLFSFLRSVENFSSHIDMQTLEMYGSVERCPIVHEPIDTEFDIREETMTSNLAGPSNPHT